MKAEYVNPFLQATQDVFRQMLNLDIEKDRIALQEDWIAGKEVNVLIGVVGALTGSVVFSFSKPMALAMVQSMAGMEISELDVFVTSALGEVGNIICGNAMTYLANAKYPCDIAPPQIILGENKTISLATPKSLLVFCKTALGEFTINISLKEKSTTPD